MKKISSNKKVAFIALPAFLFALAAIYFYSDKPTGKASTVEANTATHKTIKQTQEKNSEAHEAVKQDVAAETWAKEEFIRHEMTRGADEDNEEDEKADEQGDLRKEKFVHDEMTRDDNDEEELHDDIPLTEEESSTEEQRDEPATHDEEVPATAPEKQEEVTSEEAPPQDTVLTEDKTSSGDKKETIKENHITVSEDKEQIEDTAPIATQKSPFSAKAHILKAVVSNEPQIDGEFDPYEEIVMPNKIENLTTEESTKDQKPEATAPATHGKEELAAQAEKEAEQVREHARRSKAYLEVTSNISHLMTKFLQKTDYTKELVSIDQAKLPPEIKQVLAEMKDFAENDMKTTQANDDSKIFPKEGVLDSIAGHFVQIEKVTDSKLKDEKYEQIRKKLYILEDYFYSQKFLNEMKL